MAIKTYNGIEYDTKADYAQQKADAIAAGADQSVIDELTKKREAKIAGEGLNQDGTLMNYKTGNSYDNRETAYTWNDNGQYKTTFSNSENFEDARREAVAQGQLSDTAKLKTAVSYQKNKGTAASSSGNIYSKDDRASVNQLTGRDAYAEALARLAGLSSSNNINTGVTLDSYYPAMNDLYNYYMSLTPEEQERLSVSPDNRMSSEIEMALRTIRNGYTPTIVTTPQGTLPTMTPEELNALNTEEMAQIMGTGTTGTNGIHGNINTVGNNISTGNNVITGNTGFTGLNANDVADYFSDILNRLSNNSNNQIELLRQQLEAEKQNVNKTFDEQQNSNYVGYLRGQNTLKNSLNARGITGGAADTLLVNLNNNYLTNQNTTEQARVDALNELSNLFNESSVNIQNSLTNTLANIEQNMVDAIQKAQAAETSYNQWLIEAQMAQTNADREYALKQAEAKRDEYYRQLDYVMKQEELEFAMKQAEEENSLAWAKLNASKKSEAPDTYTGLSIGAPARNEYAQSLIDSNEDIVAVDEYINNKFDEAILKGYDQNQAEEYVVKAVQGAIRYGFINGDAYSNWLNITGAAKE